MGEGGRGGGGEVMGRWTDVGGCWLGLRGIPLRGLLEAALRPLGGCFGASWGLFWVSSGPLGAFWGPLGGFLGASWGPEGASWAPLGAEG